MFGVVSEDDFAKQLADLNSTGPRGAKVVDIQRGRGNRKEVPLEIKKIISEERIAGTPARELSELFGVSESSISAYKHDATSTASYHEPQPELKKHNDEVREGIITSARGRLMSALEQITDDKLKDAKVRDVAGIAKDMSAVIRNIEPQKEEGKSLNQQFIFYAPKMRSESDFEVIEVKD